MNPEYIPAMTGRRGRSLGFKLMLIAAVVLLACIALALVNRELLFDVSRMPERMDLVAGGRAYTAELALRVRDLGGEDAEREAAARGRVESQLAVLDRRYRLLIEGDEGFQPLQDAASLEGVRRSRELWESDIKPRILALLGTRDHA